MRTLNAKSERLRLHATIAEFPDRDAELSRLVGQVLLNAGAGENEDADRQHIEHLIVALDDNAQYMDESERAAHGVFGSATFAR
jgi:hypothetical protein